MSGAGASAHYTARRCQRDFYATRRDFLNEMSAPMLRLALHYDDMTPVTNELVAHVGARARPARVCLHWLASTASLGRPREERRRSP